MSRGVVLTKGYIAVVDDEDFDRVNLLRWVVTLTKRGTYAYHQTKGTGRQYLHRYILNVSDRAVEVDHEDHNGLNCQKYNLRVTTKSGNMRNARKWGTPTSSKYKGVCFFKRDGSWQAYINAEGKRKHLGYYSTEILAAAAYNDAAQRYFGGFACLNPL